MFSKKGFVTVCLVILAALLINGCAPATPTPAPAPAPPPIPVLILEVGDSYGGGIVAYILQIGDPGYDPKVQHGLIAATADQSTDIQWYKGEYVETDATDTAIGAGQDNTTAIVTAQGAGSYAAQLCNDLTEGGYNDWFLPSKDELNKLFLNRLVIGGFVAPYSYWSSSEDKVHPRTFAWRQSFNMGLQYLGGKEDTHRVRAVRTF